MSFETIRNVCLRLTGLEELEVGANGLTDMPQEILLLKRLKTLSLGYSTMSRNAVVTICGLANLQNLDLQAMGLTELPQDIQRLTQLLSLNLTNNRISSRQLAPIFVAGCLGF